MPCTRVRPMVDFYWPDSTPPDMATLLGEPRDDFGHRPRRDFMFRQAFLRSYQFSVQETFPQKLKRMFSSIVQEKLKEKMMESFKSLAEKAKVITFEVREGIREMGKVFLNQIRKEMTLGRLRISGFRLRMPNSRLNPIQCLSARASIVHGD